MRIAIVVGLLVAGSASAFGQQTPAQPPAVKRTASAADVAALVAKAKQNRKEGEGIIQQRLLELGPYKANIEYRASVAPAMVHEHDAEFIYVLDGAGTFVMGGKLEGERRTPQSLSGTGIEGGTSLHLAKGDAVMVPEGTPHWHSAIDSTMVAMTIHLPRPSPAADRDPAAKIHVSAADVAAIIATAKSGRKDGQANVTEPMLALAPYAANIEYRVAAGPPLVHERGAELLYVIDGTATFVMGGTLANEKRANATTLSGTGIDGGTSQHLAPGDFVLVPEGTPHGFTGVDGAIALVALHLPRS